MIVTSEMFHFDLHLQCVYPMEHIGTINEWVTHLGYQSEYYFVTNIKINIVSGNSDYDVCYSGYIGGKWSDYF